jgi:hypothetical protein
MAKKKPKMTKPSRPGKMSPKRIKLTQPYSAVNVLGGKTKP